MLGMPLPRLVPFSAGRELLQPELAHRLQHVVARLVIGAGHLAHQTLLDQRHHAVKDREAAIWSGHRLRTVQGEPTREDGEATEEALLLARQEVVAPGDRIPHRPLARGQVPSPARQKGEPVLEPHQERLRR